MDTHLAIGLVFSLVFFWALYGNPFSKTPSVVDMLLHQAALKQLRAAMGRDLPQQHCDETLKCLVEEHWNKLGYAGHYWIPSGTIYAKMACAVNDTLKEQRA